MPDALRDGAILFPRTPGEPEAFEPSLRFHFETGSSQDTLGEIVDALERHEPFIVGTWMPAVGETSPCCALAARLGSRMVVAALAEPPGDFGGLLRGILHGFGILTRDSAPVVRASCSALLKTLERFLASLASLDVRAVVLFDGAHRLSPELLERIRFLSDFAGDIAQAHGGHALQIVLIGQPELESLLSHDDLRQVRQHVSRRVRGEGLPPWDSALEDGRPDVESSIDTTTLVRTGFLNTNVSPSLRRRHPAVNALIGLALLIGVGGFGAAALRPLFSTSARPTAPSLEPARSAPSSASPVVAPPEDPNLTAPAAPPVAHTPDAGLSSDASKPAGEIPSAGAVASTGAMPLDEILEHARSLAQRPDVNAVQRIRDQLAARSIPDDPTEADALRKAVLELEEDVLEARRRQLAEDGRRLGTGR